MSCGYFYEIKRRSEDYEQHLEQQHRENSNLSEYSKEEEIWEVPEESFDNAYEQINYNEDLDEVNEDVGEDEDNDDINAVSTGALKLRQFDSPKTIRMSLSSEQIALKTQSQQCENSVLKVLNTKLKIINKSINTETDVTKSTTSVNNATTFANTTTTNVSGNKVQWKNLTLKNNNNNNNNSNERLRENNSRSPMFNFTIVPINVSEQAEKKNSEKELEIFPEIKLTSFSKRKNSLKYPTIKATVLEPRNGVKVQTSNKDFKVSTSSSISEINKHMTENSTSPESLLDNILSAASSLSVQSSSQSSNSLVADVDVHKTKEDCKSHENLLHSLNKEATGISKNQIPKLKIITAPNSPLNSQSLNVGKNISPSMLTISNISHSDSFETASNRSRSLSASPLRSLSPKVPSEAALYPDDLRCRICNELFKDPRSLNCLHSFCFQCIVNENFKEDASIPFWSQPQANQIMPASSQKQKPHDDFDCKGLNFSNNSARSASSDIHTVRSNSDLSSSPTQQKRRSSFSFKRKKSSDRLQLKIKTENSSTAVSLQTPNSAQRQQNETTRLIKCKLCQFATEIPVGGIRQLPQNFLLVRRIEEIRFKVGEEVLTRIWCSLCYEETNATYHCLTCILNLCTLCKESHERQKRTTEHNIKNIIELRRARKKEKNSHFIDNSKFVLKCSLHPGFDINSFCTVCLQVVCSDCLILLHKGHKHETIAKSINYFGRILRDSTEQTRPMCNYAEHSIGKLKEIAKSINRKCDEIQTEVEEFMTAYFEALEAHKNTLLQQVHRARESKVEMILEQQIDLEKRTQDALMAIKFSQELQDVASDVEILAFTKILLKRFEYCQQFKPPIDPKISDTLHFLPKIAAPAAKNQNDIQLYGIITMQTVEPSLCTLLWDGVSQLRLHKKAELVVITRDAEGASLWHGGLQIECRIKYKDNNVKLLPLEVTDNRDGSYIISFTPDSQGTLILTVTINDKPIKGSPFSFQARTLRPHSGIYHCCAFCSSKGNKNVKCACDGRMPGFNSCGHGHNGHPGRRHWSCCGNILENSECNVTTKLLNL